MNEERADGLAIALLWMGLVVGMVLHFNYDVSGLRYGVDIRLPDTTGVVPWSNFVVKALFYVVPFILAVVAAGGAGRGHRAVNLGFSGLFVLAHASHFVTTAMGATEVIGYAQALLLAAVLLANVQLIRLSLRWWRAARGTVAEASTTVATAR